MGKSIDNIYETLAERPLVKLNGFAKERRLSQQGTLYAYLNYGDFTGTSKDALANAMLDFAIERGELKPGQAIVEPSGGHFAVALTVAAVHRNHPIYLMLPYGVSKKQRHLLRDMGANIVDTGYGTSYETTVLYAKTFAQKKEAYLVDYFSNRDNAEYHRRVTGPALFRLLRSNIDTLVIGVGSGGTLTGVAEFCKAWMSHIWVVAVQPFECQILTNGRIAEHDITGLGPGFLPKNYNPYVVDEIISVMSGDAKQAAKDVLRTDAIPASISCGAVLCAAESVMQRRKGRTICLFNGSYLSNYITSI